MDKTFATIMLLFFILCSSSITYTVFRGHRRSQLCNYITYIYVTLLWLCVVSMGVIITVY